MILPSLDNTKSRLFLPYLSLSLIASVFSMSPLMASRDEMTAKEDISPLKRVREVNTAQGNPHVECERPLKRYKNDIITFGTDLYVYHDSSKRLWIPNDIASQIFLRSPYKSIETGWAVSQAWNHLLRSDGFCLDWSKRFAPSTPESESMTIRQFNHYFSKPSFKILEGSEPHLWPKDQRMQQSRFFLNEMPHLNDGNFSSPSVISDDGSTIIGCADDGANQNQKRAVRWVCGIIEVLPNLDNGIGAIPLDTNHDGSTSIGSSRSYKNFTLVRKSIVWKNEEVKELPRLIPEAAVTARRISSDGNIIVGWSSKNIPSKSIAVRWVDGIIEELPNPNNNDDAIAWDTNYNGSIIVGKIGQHAVVWKDMCVFSLQHLLEEAGVNLQGYHLTDATMISTNGFQITGIAKRKTPLGMEQKIFEAILP